MPDRGRQDSEAVLIQHCPHYPDGHDQASERRFASKKCEKSGLMDKKQETMSNWNCVTQLLEHEQPIELGRYNSYLTHRTPRRMLYSLSYYKFAAKMIGSKKRVLDIGCNEGLGSWVMAKECGFCKGIDFDQQAMGVAQKNFNDPSIEFEYIDFFNMPSGKWDAAVNFDVIEHIYPEHSLSFIQKISENLTEAGIAVIGTPSEISDKFASPVTKRGHVNIYSHQRLYFELSHYFHHVFLFAANDEVVHTGYLPLAHAYIALCCKPKREMRCAI